MSNDQQTPPAVLPWLPAPAPRALAARPAPPNPWVRMAAAAEFRPLPKPKRVWPKVLGALILVFGLVSVAGFVFRVLVVKMDSTQQLGSPAVPDAGPNPAVTIPGAGTPALSAPFAVDTEAFSFVLPTTPGIEELSQFGSDTTITGTQWTLVSNENMPLSVMALNYPVVLDEPAQQAAFDLMGANIAANIRGTIVSDTWATVDGVYQRDVVISSVGGSIVMKCFGKGTWAVVMVGGYAGAETPSWFADVVATFSFV